MNTTRGLRNVNGAFGAFYSRGGVGDGMPQATPELRAKFPGSDREALDVLEDNFTEKAGVFRKKSASYYPTEREWDAINYMFHEWDYCYHEEDSL